MRILNKQSVLVLTSMIGASTACAGDAVCIAQVSSASWCKPESNTCQGDASVKCSCDAPMPNKPKHANTVSGHSEGALVNSICTDIDPESWCREDGMCARLNNVSCVAGSRREIAPVRHTAPAVLYAPAPVDVVRAGSDEGHLNHSICIAIDPESWCREDRHCAKGHDKVLCGGAAMGVRARAIAQVYGMDRARAFADSAPVRDGDAVRDARAVVRRNPTAPRVERTAPRAERTRRTHVNHTQTMTLWTEWPTLEEGGWPAYFEKLLGFVNHNCGGLGFTKLIMRVNDPHFQSDRGHLWQPRTSSAFYKNFLAHLPRNMEIHIYPYLLDEPSADAWNRVRGASSPLEGVFKFVQEWNLLLESVDGKVRIAGVVTDKEEQRHFIGDLKNLRAYKKNSKGARHERLTYGTAVGYDTIGSITAKHVGEVDHFYLEMYDFYVEGSKPAIHVHAHGDSLNNPEEFIDVLDDQVWGRFVERYQNHDNITFMWSVQHLKSRECNYPTDTNCGDKVDFGSWRISKFREFMEILAVRHPVFAQRNHAIFQFSFVPKTWMPGQCN